MITRAGMKPFVSPYLQKQEVNTSFKRLLGFSEDSDDYANKSTEIISAINDSEGVKDFCKKYDVRISIQDNSSLLRYSYNYEKQVYFTVVDTETAKERTFHISKNSAFNLKEAQMSLAQEIRNLKISDLEAKLKSAPAVKIDDNHMQALKELYKTYHIKPSRPKKDKDINNTEKPDM